MSRWYDEDVRVSTVRCSLERDPAGESPERFVWRDRLYVVTEVQASWRERQPWWVLCEDAFDLVPAAGGGVAVTGDRVLSMLAESAVRRCWRVRASSGQEVGEGTYELARVTTVAPRASGNLDEPNVGGQRQGGAWQEGRSAGVGWRLMRVGD